MKRKFSSKWIRRALALTLAAVLLIVAIPFGMRESHAEPGKNDLAIKVTNKNLGVDGATVKCLNVTGETESEDGMPAAVTTDSNGEATIPNFWNLGNSSTTGQPLKVKVTISKTGFEERYIVYDLYSGVEPKTQDPMVLRKVRTNQLQFSVANPNPVQFSTGTYMNVATFTENFSDEDASISYSITGDAAVLDPETPGKLILKKAGEVTVHASANGSTIYTDPAEIYYTLKIEKSDQAALQFDGTVPTELYNGQVFQLKVTGGSGTGAVSYSFTPVEALEQKATTDGSFLAEVTANTGSVKVTATKAGGDGYNDATVSCTINISEKDLGKKYKLSDPDVIEGSERWYKEEAVITADDGYLVSFTPRTGYKKSISYTEEGKSEVDVYVREDGLWNDIAEFFSGAISKKITEVINIDGTAPGALSVSYPKPVSENENTKYYNHEVEVTLEATDTVSGVKEFNGKVEVGETEQTLNLGTPADDQGGKKTVTATIPLNANGTISFTAKDTAGNTANHTESTTIVIEKDKPVVSVTYDNNTPAVGTNIFTADRTMTITVEEANFDPSKVTFQVNKDGSSYKTGSNLTWTDTEGTNKHTAKVEFTKDGRYEITDLSVTDRCGNVSDAAVYGESSNPTSFIIDKTAPTVEVTFDNNNKTAKPYYFQEERTATIKVTESNFDPSLVIVTVKKVVGETEEPVPVSLTWSSDQSADVEFKKEGHYKLSVSAKDKAGHDATVRFSSQTVCGEEFYIDLKDPSVPQVVYPDPKRTENQPDGKTKYFYYNESVELKVITTETEFGSGLDKLVVTLPWSSGSTEDKTILADKTSVSQDTETGLRTYTAESPKTPVESLTVPEGANGTVKVTAYDVSGRSTVSDEKVIIITDVTAPTIDVSFDNNDAQGEGENKIWFKADRTMTVKIVEQYFHPEDVVLKVSTKKHASDTWTEKAYTADELKALFKKAAEENTYKGTVEFSDDNFYKIELSYADPAGNPGTITYAEGTVAPTEFVIDKTAPKINISADNNSAQNEKYFKAPRTYTIVVDEVNFDASLVKLDVKKKAFADSTFSEMSLSPAFTQDGDKYTATITFDKDAEYTFDISYTDQAGNVNKTPVYAEGTVCEKNFIIDRTAPALAVSYDNNSARNGNVFDADRTMTITVTDEYFSPAFVNFAIQATDKDGKAVKVDDVQAALRKESAWTHAGAVHTAKVPFTVEANYSLAVSLLDLAGNANTAVSTSGSVAPFAFTIDKTTPTASIAVGSFSSSKDGTSWDHLLTTFSYALFSKQLVSVVVESADELSGVEKVEYILTDEKLSAAALNARTDWKNAAPEKFTLPIQKDAQFIVYVRLNDRAGNGLLLSSDGVTIDITNPVVDKVAPVVTVNPAQPVNGIYNSNVLFDVTAEDQVVEGVYSGLKRVEYAVYNRSVSLDSPTATGVLYSFDKEYPEKQEAAQIYSRDHAFTVNAEANNTNDVLVRVTATDMAGNTAYAESTVKIDVTAPTISVSYNNNSALSNLYFKEQRTATITVNERNFDPARVQVTANATNGASASLSGWTQSGGSGNGDNTVWTAQLSYTADGDYSFSISMTDEAGNPSSAAVFENGTVASEHFILDQEKAAVRVSYDNNAAEKQYFYKAPRKATITITEQNFDPENVRIVLVGTVEGKEVKLPVLSSWTSNGTEHSATLLYNEDGDYEFTLNFTDMAGNVSDQYGMEHFTIDQTAPKLTIGGVKDQSANAGDVEPVVTYSDINVDADTFEITLVGANRGKVEFTGSGKGIENGLEYTLANFEEIKENDDIYTLTAVIRDAAGNETTESIRFSVNRFGSVYELGDAAAKMNNGWFQKGSELVIREINADSLNNVKVTLYKNNETIVLKEGVDYTVSSEGGDGEWLTYTYTIAESNFADDAVYRVIIHSEDAAGNVAENTQDSKGAELLFGIDKTAPIVSAINLESGKTYAADEMTVLFSASDNLQLQELNVYVDGSETPAASFDAEKIQEIRTSGGDFSFDLAGGTNSARTIRFEAIDMAGNTAFEDILDFYLTSNLWVRYYNNKGLFFGSIGGVGGLAALLAVLLVLKRRKQEEKA